MVARVRKGDTVEVIAGKDMGKRGAVLVLNPTQSKVLVKDVAVVVRHSKSRKQGEQGTIKKRESFVALCKVMPVCSSCNKSCRVNAKVVEQGKRVRMCNLCKEIF